MQSWTRRYRSLLTAEESLPTLRKALDLAEEILKEFGKPSTLPGGQADALDALKSLHRQKTRGSKTKNVDSKSEAIGDACSRGSILLQAAPASANAPHVDNKIASLLLDLCLVIFHQMYYALLPILEERGEKALREMMLDILTGFAQQWNEPADRAHLLALCYEFAGDVERAATSHADAVRATPSDAHNFMTLLQTHWQFLIDHERIAEALDVLLEAYPRVCRKDLEEMRELVRTTFALQQQMTPRPVAS
jgi:hypothetical protein